MKKFLSALMAIVLAISTALAASAAFDSRTAENSTVEIPTLYFDSAEAYERHLNQLKSDVSTHANGNAVISAAVVRSGSSEDCELYIEWDGNAVYKKQQKYIGIVEKTSLSILLGKIKSATLMCKIKIALSKLSEKTFLVNDLLSEQNPLTHLKIGW